ncbi:MAG: hypothetical protein ACRD1S_09120 [Vicinamibacterales bacterium]
MTATEMKSLVGAVIVHYGLPFTVLSVIGSPDGWNILVRAGTGGIVRFTVADGRPVDLREAIQGTLEAQL